MLQTQSPATRYTFGMILWMSLYVVAIVFNGFYFRQQTPTGPLLYTLAILPALPVGGSIWVILRFIAKSDEYVRSVMSQRFILTTGLTLFICTAYGFLENYANVQHFDLYYVYILFWVCFGLVGAVSAIRGRA
ncbi:MAG: hypothetical protein QM647_06410 [Asticcacaulis sp.]|uniref:hypothetical protein n=1 Tax=Asticcacaulis sp. TaxID=1872648 RepID=UPI0039E63E9F